MCIILLVTFWCACAVAEDVTYYALEDSAQHFDDFIIKFDKHYESEEEKAARFEIFKANLEHINRSNMESEHAVFGITRFTDLTTEEFVAMHTGLHESIDVGDGFCNVVSEGAIPDSGAPESFDWRSRNVVTEAKDQGRCGSCYAFSAIGHIESQYAIKTGQLLDLSEQQIVDCDTISKGCRGGYPAASFRALMGLGGSMNEADYPYQAVREQCRSNPSRAVVHLSNCYTYNIQSQDKLKQLLYQTGPLSIAIQANVLQWYNGGIVTDSSCDGPINHAVLLVGYGMDSNMPYWIVKNSWGPSWGEQGFFRLQRSQNPGGACSMLNENMASAVIQ